MWIDLPFCSLYLAVHFIVLTTQAQRSRSFCSAINACNYFLDSVSAHDAVANGVFARFNAKKVHKNSFTFYTLMFSLVVCLQIHVSVRLWSLSFDKFSPLLKSFATKTCTNWTPLIILVRVAWATLSTRR